MDQAFLEALYDHMEWADALTWRTVLAEPHLAEDEFIVESLFHLHMVQHAWISVWRSEEFAIPVREDFDELVSIRDWARAYHSEATAVVAGLTSERLAEPLEVPWVEFIEREIGRTPVPARVLDSVYQVAAHSAHHRAQINRRIRELGVRPEMVDYIGWVWRDRPPADWHA